MLRLEEGSWKRAYAGNALAPYPTQMVQVVENLRLTHRDATVRFVYELACQHAASTGETAPACGRCAPSARRSQPRCDCWLMGGRKSSAIAIA